MDRELWMILCRAIRGAVRAAGASRRVMFSDLLILKMYIWSVAHDRPLWWACQKQHYHSVFRPRRLPSVSQFCRRVKSDLFQRHLQAVHQALTQNCQWQGLNFLDGKPLEVGNYSRDPEAKTGFAAGRLGKGYKLHALVTQDRRIATWCVLPMNVHEMKVAQAMIGQGPTMSRMSPGTVFMADGNYDAHVFHKQIAAAGGSLYIKPRGVARHPVTRRQMGGARRQLIEFWQKLPEQAQWIYNERVNVEGTFSNLCSYGGGLGPLPAFVRRLERVRRWTGAKICLYHARLEQRSPRCA